MNRWKITDELMNENKADVESFIKELESDEHKKSDKYLSKDFSDTKLNPSTLCGILESLGYEEDDMSTNGWELDFDITMVKQGFRSISVQGCGMTFELMLSEMEDI